MPWTRWGAEEGEVITHPLVTSSIGRAQKRVEGNNFEARKKLLDYDDVMNQQREVIYDLRLFALEGGEDLKGELWEMVRHVMEAGFEDYLPASGLREGIEVDGLRQRMLLDLHTVLPHIEDEDDPEEVSREEVLRVAEEAVQESFDRKIESLGEHAERVMSFVMLSTIDGKWKDHLYDLDHLKASIGFRGWGQKDPLVEYKKEAYEMFVGLIDDLRRAVTQQLFRVRLEQRPAMSFQSQRRLSYSGPSDTQGGGLQNRGGGRPAPGARRPAAGGGAGSGLDGRRGDRAAGIRAGSGGATDRCWKAGHQPGRSAAQEAGHRGPDTGPECSLPVWKREKVQEVSRSPGLATGETPRGAGSGEAPVWRSAAAVHPAEARPRERLQRYGPGPLSEQELLALLIGAGSRATPAHVLAERVLDLSGGRLRELARMDHGRLVAIPGIGPAVAARIVAAIEARRPRRVGPRRTLAPDYRARRRPRHLRPRPRPPRPRGVPRPPPQLPELPHLPAPDHPGHPRRFPHPPPRGLPRRDRAQGRGADPGPQPPVRQPRTVSRRPQGHASA